MNEGVLQQVGTPDRGLSASGEPVRGPVHRQPDHECGQRRGAPGDDHTAVVLGDNDAVLSFPQPLFHLIVDKKHAEDELAIGVRPEGVLVATPADAGLHPGGGAHHRAARTLRHRRPEVRQAVAARAHAQRLRGEGGRRGVGEAGREADPLLQHPHRRIAARSGSEIWPTSTLDKVSKKFGRHTALNELSLDMRDGEFFVLLGPDRRGQDDDAAPDRRAGHAQHREHLTSIGRTSVTGARPSATWRWCSSTTRCIRTTRCGRTWSSRCARRCATWRARTSTARVAQAAKTLRIEHLLERKTDRLSGGEMQRVSIGRAIVREPRVFLMDEPLSNLDAKLREILRAELKDLQMKLGATFLYVTHDQVEAMSHGRQDRRAQPGPHRAGRARRSRSTTIRATRSWRRSSARRP